jgi:hypothetical protein
MFTKRIRRILFCIMPATLLASCAALRAPRPALPPAPDAFQAAYYAQAEARGMQVLRIDPQQSLIAITVYRGGALARLGHDHVIASRTVAGYVAPQAGRADLHFRLDQLTVDEAGLRAEAGLKTQPSPDDIVGTRRNMLTKVLDAERFPDVLIHATRATPGAAGLTVAITLHGVTRTLALPATLELKRGSLTVSGKFSLNQSAFGIVPLSVLGGAMKVEDRIDLRFRLVATERTSPR